MEKRLSKEERKALLKKAGLTKEDIKKAWEECILLEFKPVIDFSNAGCTWKDLPASIMENLPTIIRNFRIEKEKARIIMTSFGDFDDEFDDVVLDSIDNEQPLYEYQIKRLLFNGYEVDRKVGENRHWSRTVKSVVEVKERTFLIEWKEGLAEHKENEFYSQPIEVRKQEHEKMVKVTEWIPIDKEDREVDEDEIEME